MSRLIDADALYQIVKLAWDTSDSEDFEKSVFIAIATAPTIEPKKGKWIDSERPKWDGTTYFLRQCSVCGYERTDCNADLDTAYCPNCGADMRGEGHETN